MAKSIKGSRTEKNLLAAFAGESQLSRTSAAISEPRGHEPSDPDLCWSCLRPAVFLAGRPQENDAG